MQPSMPEIKGNENVRVVVRCRPLNLEEQQSGYYSVVSVVKTDNAIKIFNPKENDVSGKTFTFDGIYNFDATQEDLYKESVQPVVRSVLDGFSGTVLVYGQTGTGKTFTMEGDSYQNGILQKSFEQIFDHIARSKNEQYLVRASYIEIYQEEIKDLLDENSDKTYELKGDGSGVCIKHLKSHICKNANEMEALMNIGRMNRKVGATDMNFHSSRSHAVFSVTIEMSRVTSGINHIIVGKLNLVDLAGSERQSKSCATGDRLKEAVKINLSLSALGNVISALSNGKNGHVPYRDSKLTRLLQESLGGCSKTLMIANIGPASYNYDESLTTLRYANRAKNIQNKPQINEHPKDALIRQYQDEITKLKALLHSKQEERTKLSVENGENIITYHKKEIASSDGIEIYQLSATSLSDEEELKEMRDEAEQERLSLLKLTTHNIETLKKQICSMESQLLHGTDIVQHTKNQKEILTKQSEEIKERAMCKINLELQLGKEKKTTEELKDSQINLQHDIEKKTKKLIKYYCKLQMVRQSIVDSVDEFNKDRNDLELAQSELIKEFKLNQLIIDNFISESDRKNVMNNMHYDNDEEKWKTTNENNSILQRIFANHQENCLESESSIFVKQNYRSSTKNDNIIRLGLEQHINSVSQYRSPKVPVIIKCVLENALIPDEDDITLDAATSRTNLMRIERGTANSFASECPNNSVVYPKVRGLVKKY